jgi:SulP family sulfate permease
MIVDMTEVATLGVSSSLALEKLILEDLSKNLPVFLVGMNDAVRNRLGKLGLLEKLSADHVLETRQEALEKAYALVD